MTRRTLVGLTIALIVAITQVPAAAIQLDPVLSGLSSPLLVTPLGSGRGRHKRRDGRERPGGLRLDGGEQ
jgi:hypothetical protein